MTKPFEVVVTFKEVAAFEEMVAFEEVESGTDSDCTLGSSEEQELGSFASLEEEFGSFVNFVKAYKAGCTEVECLRAVHMVS
mmetsp:Transcript_22986/g.17422  ORF Transcript_22986/g.17422 Transcript_22986/m.17422 type:complete len:82 (-) Transcript_22986:1264-1509(-)|eukprot:CAMPEP_0202960082 /NCGR_PEP_ID=MMETSP1396-20130829/4244_1 /ASSEMBLY_ACC=CAM_ASM_000872 /TAXON_ID= /ORGANISM="Pseudokeronopsis sp., Strain Brazil" /LENGTH=81 /DNA_ID=CAMNT_0049679063 /DNA_START=492 /DNA_END=737 /DNA_ORIENTATION=+